MLLLQFSNASAFVLFFCEDLMGLLIATDEDLRLLGDRRRLQPPPDVVHARPPHQQWLMWATSRATTRLRLPPTIGRGNNLAWIGLPLGSPSFLGTMTGGRQILDPTVCNGPLVSEEPLWRSNDETWIIYDC